VLSLQQLLLMFKFRDYVRSVIHNISKHGLTTAMQHQQNERK